MKVIGSIATGVLALALLFGGLYWGGVLSNNVQASYNKRVVTSKIEQNVNTATFAQATYEQFFSDCNAYVAMNTQIDAAKQRVADAKTNVLAATDGLSKSQALQAESAAEADLTGAIQQQANVAARYAAASAEYTRGQFKDANLPVSLDQSVTTCQ